MLGARRRRIAAVSGRDVRRRVHGFRHPQRPRSRTGAPRDDARDGSRAVASRSSSSRSPETASWDRSLASTCTRSCRTSARCSPERPEYRYLQRSIAAFPPADEFAQRMGEAGLIVTAPEPPHLRGLYHLYVGERAWGAVSASVERSAFAARVPSLERFSSSRSRKTRPKPCVRAGTTLLALPAPVAPIEALLAGMPKVQEAIAWGAPSGFELAALGTAGVVEASGAARFRQVAELWASAARWCAWARALGRSGSRATSLRWLLVRGPHAELGSVAAVRRGALCPAGAELRRRRRRGSARCRDRRRQARAAGGAKRARRRSRACVPRRRARARSRGGRGLVRRPEERASRGRMGAPRRGDS